MENWCIVRGKGLKLGDMEHWMDLGFGWKLQLVGCLANAFQYFVRAIIFQAQFGIRTVKDRMLSVWLEL
jgi:hypothetical protein